MKNLIQTMLAYIIFIVLCALGVAILLMILKFIGWMLSIEWIRNTILVLCFIGTATMLYEELGKEE